MAAKSDIEWTQATWNPIAGCSIVSAGCRECYAMRRVAPRLASNPATPHYAGTVEPSKAGYVWTGKIGIASDKVFLAPLRTRKPTTFFVNSVSDLFHEGVPDEVIDRIFAVMALCPQHTFQVLTKRPERMREYLSDGATRLRVLQEGVDRELAAAGIRWNGDWNDRHSQAIAGATRWPLPNVWLGTSAEDQKTADARIPHLLATPAAIRFLSAEPLLGEMDLASVSPNGVQMINALRGYSCTPDYAGWPRLDWVIVGGESGRNARPMHPDWARQIRDQCAAAGVPFFFKQWGEWGMPPCSLDNLDWGYHQFAKWHANAHWFDNRTCVRPVEAGWSDKYIGGGGAWPPPPFDMFKTPEFLDQVARCPQASCRDAGRCMGNEKRAAVVWLGKKAAGRLLDGVEHDGMPEVRR